MTTSRRRLNEVLRVKPGTHVRLADIDPSDSHGYTKETAKPELQKGLDRLTDLQDRLWAEAKHPVLVVLQGIDAAGKDGSVKHVMGAFNPMGCSVTSFKVPTPVEAAHDYLWRVHQRTPARGEIAIFNRSHYEDVLVVRVHDLVPKKAWQQRFDHINAFERLLTDEGTTILKFFLLIDREEQKLWDDYAAAYEDVLQRCSTDQAPWYVIPANRNWFRNLAIAEILADTLEDLKPTYPRPTEDLSKVVIE
jgi:PPK2 family polyphosphate:nucleotide phosphotransferase